MRAVHGARHSVLRPEGGGRPDRRAAVAARAIAAGTLALMAIAAPGDSAAKIAPDSAPPAAVFLSRRASPQVAGVFTLTPKTRDRWTWSAAWRFPVGDPRDFEAPGPGKEPAFRLLRGQGARGGGTARHDGADLGCGKSGTPVRAAASGLVLVADRTGWNSGYGLYVVLGHRLPEGEMVYSIYAHLAEGSIVVRPGQTVSAGNRLGRVGRTGRATTSHLHFEVRKAGEPGLRWEKETTLDPIKFVSARLAPPYAPTKLDPYVDWALYSGLLEEPADPTARLARADWWRMLAVSARHDLVSFPDEPEALAESLIAIGVLPETPRPPTTRPLEWSEIARDLERIRDRGLRLPTRPLANTQHRAACEEWMGTREPSRGIDRAAKLNTGHPTVASALLAVADLAPALEPPVPKRKRRSPAPADSAAIARRVADSTGAKLSPKADSSATARRRPTPRSPESTAPAKPGAAPRRGRTAGGGP